MITATEAHKEYLNMKPNKEKITELYNEIIDDIDIEIKDNIKCRDIEGIDINKSISVVLLTHKLYPLDTLYFVIAESVLKTIQDHGYKLYYKVNPAKTSKIFPFIFSSKRFLYDMYTSKIIVTIDCLNDPDIKIDSEFHRLVINN